MVDAFACEMGRYQTKVHGVVPVECFCYLMQLNNALTNSLPGDFYVCWICEYLYEYLCSNLVKIAYIFYLVRQPKAVRIFFARYFTSF